MEASVGSEVAAARPPPPAPEEPATSMPAEGQAVDLFQRQASAEAPALFAGTNIAAEVAAGGGKHQTVHYNPQARSFLRNQYINTQLRKREHEFTTNRPIRLFVATWNVNGKPPQDDLTSWLRGGIGAGEPMPDVVVVGLQEMVDLTAGNMVNATLSAKRGAMWTEAVLATLNEGLSPGQGQHRFWAVRSEFLVGVLCLVLAKEHLRPAISHVQGAIAITGLLGVMGNKGACAIRMNVFDSSLCFVVSHLAAHRGNVDGRNADFNAIMDKLAFRDAPQRGGEEPLTSPQEWDAAAAASGDASPAADTGAQSSGGATPAEGGGGPGEGPAVSSSVGHLGVEDHDFVFWCGDLNYRIHSSLSVPEVLQLARACEAGDEAAFERLRSLDQLNMVRQARRAFGGFVEGDIHFVPTYKFIPGQDVYDDRPDKKNRAPAWCDRVLWRTGPEEADSVGLVYYGCTRDQLASDHKPVHALLDVAVRQRAEGERRRVLEEIQADLFALQGDTMPVVSLSRNTLDMGDVVLGVHKTASVTLANTGSVLAHWYFVPKLGDVAVARPWLSVDPVCGNLRPGESVQLSLRVAHSVAVSRRAALGAITTLDEILVLRVDKGQDHFLAVSASPLPSAFGCSLEQLSRRPEPVRALGYPTLATSVHPLADEGVVEATPEDDWDWSESVVVGDLLGIGAEPASVRRRATFSEASRVAEAALSSHGGGGGSSPSGPVPAGTGKGMLAVPKEMWRLVDALLRRSALGARGLFLRPGDPTQCAAAREALDTGTSIPSSVGPLALAHTLLQLLASFREPLIPCPLFPGPDFTPAHVAPYCAMLVRRLTPVRFNCLIYLLAFARECLSPAHAALNGATVETLAFVLSRVCMRGVVHDAIGLLDGVGGGEGEGTTEAPAVPLQGNFTVTMTGVDPGSNWHPTPAEQTHMTAIFAHLLTSSQLTW